MMRARSLLVLGFATTLGCNGDDSTGPCSTSVPALKLSVWRPIGAHATLIYNRHGDDSLTIVDIPSTGSASEIGKKPGIYDFRVITAGYADWITTNLEIRAQGCGSPRTVEMQIFMQPPRKP